MSSERPLNRWISSLQKRQRKFEVQLNTFSPKKLLKLNSVTQNCIIFFIILDMAFRHDTHYEKYGNFGKQSGTNGEEDEELCWTPISHTYQPTRF